MPKKERTFNTKCVLAALFGIGICVLFMMTPTLFAYPDNAEFVGDETCLTCHDTYEDTFVKTPHGRVNMVDKDPVVSCESCHGPGSVHMDTEDPANIFNPGKAESSEQVETCNECHGKLNTGFGFVHTDEAGGCSDCHVVHSENTNLLHKQGSDLCFGCHADVRGYFAMPSHHPVLENRMQCSDCHMVHGSKASLTSYDTQRDQCLSCHVGKQGPFVFEHDPVAEDCSICHSAHGSVADNLLIQAEPFVCLSCHPMHFHTGVPGYEGDFTAPLHPERGGTSTTEGFKPAMLTKCTQCHTEVHGSDLPAQSISGPGALIR
jgi:DmsE family decaheme c-type cytochrome